MVDVKQRDPVWALAGPSKYQSALPSTRLSHWHRDWNPRGSIHDYGEGELPPKDRKDTSTKEGCPGKNNCKLVHVQSLIECVLTQASRDFSRMTWCISLIPQGSIGFWPCKRIPHRICDPVLTLSGKLWVATIWRWTQPHWWAGALGFGMTM